MKPTLRTLSSKAQTGSSSFNGTQRDLPKTDYNYHNSNLADFGGRCGGSYKGARSFREISQSYSNHEARHSFIAEAAFFALIIMTAAVPVLEGARALSVLVRSVGVL